MTVRELTAALAKGEPAPVYAVLGEEAYLRDRAVAALKAAVGGGDERGIEAFNLDLLYGDECGAADILARATEAPVFAARRLVLIKAADKLPAREGEALVPYLKAPCDSTILVLVAGKLDGRTKFGQAVAKHAVAVDCSRLPAGQLPAWIKEEARAVGVPLTEDAVHLLAELAGDSLALARRELEKLAAYVPRGRPAGPADVEALRGGEPGASVFDLSSAIAAGARAQALRILARNFEAGEAPVRILGSLVWQYRQICCGRGVRRRRPRECSACRPIAWPGSPPWRGGCRRRTCGRRSRCSRRPTRG